MHADIQRLALDSVGYSSYNAKFVWSQGYDGESYTEGCLKNTCKAGTWRTSMDGALCCYDREPYQKNTTITSTVTEDGCVRATTKCGEDGDKAMMILHTENYCEDHSTVEQVAEIKQLLIEHMDQKGIKC